MSDILVRQEGAITVIAFNRLAKKNSITAAMYSQMADALDAAAAASEVRCLLIHGDPTIFSAGNDIGDFLNTPAFGRGLAGIPFPQVAVDFSEADHRGRLWTGGRHRHHAPAPL